MEGRKSAISVRMGASELRKIKAIAKRLGVRESDVFRYAVKNSLAQLAPLEDSSIRGRNLLPVFVENGLTLVRYFDLDATRLGDIVNAGVEDAESLVAAEDLTLLSMAGLRLSYALVKLNEILEDPAAIPAESDGVLEILRGYLYEKYAFRTAKNDAGGEAMNSVSVPPSAERLAE